MLGKADGALDFARPPRAVRDRIRGVDPWPGAVATLDGEPIKLFGAALAAGEGPPGAVVALDAGGATIACAGGAVRVAELQAPGKKRMRWADFVRGRAVPLGTVLGPGPVA
jgi:methionyl-tRNA formyltransferase